MIKTYSNKRDGNKQLSPHFKVREFAEPGNDEVKIDDRLLPLLEAIYAALDCTKIIITSGYRTDQNASRHAEGRAADINCWHMVDGKEVRYQGREILLAAEDAGVTGIGWIAGSATSRAAVHIDTRDTPYRFDEANGNRTTAGMPISASRSPAPKRPQILSIRCTPRVKSGWRKSPTAAQAATAMPVGPSVPSRASVPSWRGGISSIECISAESAGCGCPGSRTTRTTPGCTA